MRFTGVAAAALTIGLAVFSGAQTAASRPPITGISHIGVYSSDAAKTERFYVHDLGGVKRSDPENAAGVRYYFSPVQFVEVLPLPAGADSIDRLDHVAFDTSDAQKLWEYLGAHSIAVPAKVETASDGSRWFDVIDPEGNKVEFVQPPAHPSPLAVNPLSGHMIHVGYLVHNPEAENPFFRKILGFRPYWYGGRDGKTEWISQQVPDGTDWIEYMVAGTPETKGIPQGMSQENLGVLNHFSLGVFSMKKSADLLESGGRLTARHSPPQIGADGKWQLNIYDPDGTRAELMEFQPVAKPCCSDFTAASPTK